MKYKQVKADWYGLIMWVLVLFFITLRIILK